MNIEQMNIEHRWYQKHKELLESLTLYDIGLGIKRPSPPWCISFEGKSPPSFLEETPMIPFWHGIQKATKHTPWWRRLLTSS